MPEYKHDLFVSYKSEDFAWAKRIADEMSGRGFDVFLDQKRLVAGAPWEEQLRDAVRGSRHYLVLVSTKAQASDWVRREMATFDAAIHPPTHGGIADQTRKFIVVPLDSRDAAYASLHMATDLEPHYAGGAEGVSADVWRQVGDRIETALKDQDDGTIRIARAVVAMTAADVDALTFTYRDAQRQLVDVLPTFGIPDKADLKRLYGPTRSDWKPFGSAGQTVESVLESVRAQVNGAGGPPFRWDPVDDDLWSDDVDRREQAAFALTSRFSVVVIDPLSLYDTEVTRIVANHLFRVFDNPNAIVMVLTPFPMLAPNLHLRSVVRQLATRIFSQFYEEPPLRARMPYANCSVFTGDELDIRRLLRALLRVYTGAGRDEASSKVLGVGGR